MTRLPFEAALTPDQAHAAATAYGWSVLPHDNGGFFAQLGEHCMTVVFNDDRTFRCAHIQQGANSMLAMVPEDLVIGRFAQHGRPEGRAGEDRGLTLGSEVELGDVVSVAGLPDATVRAISISGFDDWVTVNPGAPDQWMVRADQYVKVIRPERPAGSEEAGG